MSVLLNIKTARTMKHCLLAATMLVPSVALAQPPTGQTSITVDTLATNFEAKIQSSGYPGVNLGAGTAKGVSLSSIQQAAAAAQLASTLAQRAASTGQQTGTSAQQIASTAQQSAATAQTAAQSALPASKLGVAGGASPLNSCAVRPSRTYAGAIIGASDLASAANIPNLQASHNVSFYLTSYALTQAAGLSVAAIESNWSGQATGIIEVGTDPVNMPDIAANYAAQVTAAGGWTWGTTKGTTWPALIAAGGWRPVIAALNPFNMGTMNSLTDPDYLMNLAAIADVKAAAPSIKYVLPYLTANGQQVNATLADNDWTLPYWGESRALALAAGGIGFDTPANYFNKIREPAYRTLTVQQIKWAAANGIISEVLLSPYALPAVAGTQPQFQYDATFFEAVQAEIAFLHSNGADPTFYVVANYSEGAGTNAPGSDTDPGGETLNAVALWVARNAPTSPMPAALPSTLQAEPNARQHRRRCCDWPVRALGAVQRAACTRLGRRRSRVEHSPADVPPPR